MALEKLGYRVCGGISLRLKGVKKPDFEKQMYAKAYVLVEKYDAFQDNPWFIIYKELVEKYPNSKFLITLRDTESWIKSQVANFGCIETPMRKWIYGVGYPGGNENIYVKRYEDHHKDVIDYIKDRPGDLLVLDLQKGDGWKEICSFLQKDIPDIPFPHANKTGEIKKANPRIWQLARKAKKMVIKVKKKVSRIVRCCN